MKNLYAFLSLIATNNKERANPFVAWPLPRIDLFQYEGTVLEGVASLLKQTSGLEMYDGKTGWVIVQHCQAYDGGNDIWLPYTALLPEPVPLNDGYQWKNIFEIFHSPEINELEKKLLFYTGAKI